jgi:hypothetical protein
MDAINPAHVTTLISHRPAPCVSLYTPTHSVGREGENDPRRLEALIDEAQQRLERHMRRRVDAREFVAPLRELVANEDFWSRRSEGLAAFLAADELLTYRVPKRFEPRVAVTSRFLIRPLLPYLTQTDKFCILALSEHHVCLFDGDRRGLTGRETPELPVRRENLAATDQGRKQVHIGGADPTHRHSSIYHGHGGKPDARKDEISLFLRSLVAPLRKLLPADGTPVILAGVKSLLAMFREIFDHPAVAKLQLEESCDHIADAKLHAQVYPILEGLLADARDRKAAKAFAEADVAMCTRDVHVIVPIAHHGGVEMLVVARDANLHGEYDAASDVTQVRLEGDEADDLVDLAAVDTLRNRGQVVVVEREKVPGCADMAAVLRRGWASQGPMSNALAVGS